MLRGRSCATLVPVLGRTARDVPGRCNRFRRASPLTSLCEWRMAGGRHASSAAQLEEPGWPFSIMREVDWGEKDAFNHVNNVVFLRAFIFPCVFFVLLCFAFISTHRLVAGWFETVRCEHALKLGTHHSTALLLLCHHRTRSSRRLDGQNGGEG